MRLKVTFEELKEEITIEKEYRKYFISFIKNVFTQTNLFTEIYSDKKVRPFTFSVFLGNDFEILDRDIKIKSPIDLIFSTGDYFIFTNFYNGVLELKKKKQGIIWKNGKVIPVKDIVLLRNVKINSSCAIFKTIGVSVVTDPEKRAKNFEKWYCVPGEDNLQEFNRVLEKRMLEKYERMVGKRLDTQIKFTPVSEKEMEIFIRQGKIPLSFGTKPIKEVYVKHYNGFIKGFKGVFYLESHPEMLQFIYDYGLGVRTGQGFGLLEVIVQI